MTNNFYPPITPPPELVKQWCYEDGDEVSTSPRWLHIVCTKAARWGAGQQLDLDAEQINQAWQKGADHELEACCEWVSQWCGRWPDGTRPEGELRAARRPKPPNLEEEALAVLGDASDRLDAAHENIIRRAWSNSMTDNNHPINPPPELVQQWMQEASGQPPGPDARVIATLAARWGADHELEACCKWLGDGRRENLSQVLALHAARRPKPLSLKELNLKHLEVMERDGHYLPEIIADLRRAIESLPS